MKFDLSFVSYIRSKFENLELWRDITLERNMIKSSVKANWVASGLKNNKGAKKVKFKLICKNCGREPFSNFALFLLSVSVREPVSTFTQINLDIYRTFSESFM